MKTTKQSLKELKTINIKQLDIEICGIEKAIFIAVTNTLNKDYTTASKIVCERVAKEIFINKKYVIA